MRISERLICLICAILMILTFMPYSEAVALSDYASGKCGNDLTWVFNNGVLTVSGTGNMFQYGCDERENVPWHSYKDQITKVVIEEGVTSIGMHMFSSCENLTDVSLPSTLLVIYNRAFQWCGKLQSLYIPYGVTTLNHFAFCADNLLAIYIPTSVSSFGDYLFTGNYNLTIVCEPGSEAEKYAIKNNIKYTNDKYFMYTLEDYKKTLIENEEYILSCNKVDFNVTYCINRTKKTLKLNWDDVSGAKKYKIYRYDYTKGEFKFIGCVEKSQCIIKKIKFNQKNYFRIDAVTDEGIIQDEVYFKNLK